ncbi:MAG: phosphoribosylformylglycinamidine synthase subunit PurQ [Erythrobacter sp.]
MAHPSNNFRAAVITFPGSNCDRDMAVALEAVTGEPAIRVWHGDADLPDRLDFIALPGGFSYGDYLRSGAMAAKSPVLRAVVSAAERGVPVLGVCNGFQVLTESGLLPGALMRNAGQTFVCRTVELEVVNTSSPFTNGYDKGATLRIPVAHHDGNYFADEATLDRLDADGRVAFRYVENPNGSRRDIAGVLSANGRVLGMMPHPERAMEPVAHRAMGGEDGRGIFENVVRNLVAA